jgi:hypothetical protein
VAPCDSCPFLRPYKAVGAPHHAASPQHLLQKPGGTGGRGKFKRPSRKLLSSSSSSSSSLTTTTTSTKTISKKVFAYPEWKLNQLFSKMQSFVNQKQNITSSSSSRMLKEMMTPEVKKYFEMHSRRHNHTKMNANHGSDIGGGGINEGVSEGGGINDISLNGVNGIGGGIRLHHQHRLSLEARRNQISPLKLHEAGIISEDEMHAMISRPLREETMQPIRKPPPPGALLKLQQHPHPPIAGGPGASSPQGAGGGDSDALDVAAARAAARAKARARARKPAAPH